MSEVKQYIQCRLERETSPGTVLVQMAWIPADGVKVGVRVELLPSRALWKVAHVGEGVVLPEGNLKEMQTQHRGSLPSVEPIGR